MNLLIYGAYGYTGELIARRAVEKGYFPLLGGRDREKLRRLAHELQVHYVAFDLNDTPALNRVLSEYDLVLNCAGPFSKTVRPLVEACLRNKVHYIDITGEIEVFEYLASKDAEAKETSIVLMPGTGFDVVPTDCLAAFLKTKMPDATQLELAISGVGSISRGTALTMLENIHRPGMIRKEGKLTEVPVAYKTRRIPFLKYDRMAVTIPWGDVSTAWYSTGIPNVKVYAAVNEKTLRYMKASRYIGWLLKTKPVQRYLHNQISQTVKGPDEKKRTTAQTYIWGEVKNAVGLTATARLETPEPYHLTAITALAAAERVSQMFMISGFKTPSLAFGPDFILEVPGVRRDYCDC